MITDDFSTISPSPAGNAARWDDTVASAASLAFVAGSTQAIELAATATGVSFLANVVNPTKIHQSVEIRVVLGSTLGSTAFSGAFCRFTDVNNFVMVRVNHNTRQAQLVEMIAGTPTVLATAPLTAAAGITGCSVRIECIGKRARIWFEPHFRDVPDEPPDIAADLAGTYTEVGEWGIYMNSNTTNADMRVCRFMARELPSKFLPPPFLIAAAATGYNLVPITATASAVNASAGSLEWEVYPVDSDDFAEAYKDTAVASITSRVFWVRAGYSYDVRVRELKKNGGNNPWTAFSRVTATGVKVPPASPDLPDTDFPDVTPDYVLDREQTADVSAVVSDSGRSRLSAPYIRPGNTFKLLFQNRGKTECQLLINFFEEMQGKNAPFKWVHPFGEQFAMHFASDDYELTTVDATPEGTDGILSDLSFDIAEYVVGGVGTLSVALTVDPALRGM